MVVNIFSERVYLEVERSKFKVSRYKWPKISHYLRNGKSDELQTWYTDGVIRWPASRTCAVTSKVIGQGNKIMSSEWCTFDHNSTTKNHRHAKIGRKAVRSTADIRTSSKVKRSKVKVTRPLNAVTENQPCLRNGKAYILQTWCTDGIIR